MQVTDTLMRLEPLAGGHGGNLAEDAELRLVRASADGDEDAFAALVRRHQGRVFRLAGRFFRQPQDVEEVAQETFLRAWMKLDTYSARAPFEHWLTRLCLRCAYDRLRRSGAPRSARAARQTTAEEQRPAGLHRGAPGTAAAASLNGVFDPEEMAAPGSDPDARLEVSRLLARLAPADRFLLVLLEAEGWSVAEIAERLGLSRVNVKVRAHRARQKLRRVLEEG
jgi:RNA polymerase sigma-70 factor (ECF subfamily)